MISNKDNAVYTETVTIQGGLTISNSTTSSVTVVEDISGRTILYILNSENKDDYLGVNGVVSGTIGSQVFTYDSALLSIATDASDEGKWVEANGTNVGVTHREITVDASSTATSLVSTTEIAENDLAILTKADNSFVEGSLGVVTFDGSLYTADITSFSLGETPTKAFFNDDVTVAIDIEDTADRVITQDEVLDKVSSTTTQFVGTNARSGMLVTGDTIQLDGATEVVSTGVVENVGSALKANNEFETVLYTGNGAAQTVPMANITGGVDFVWTKVRSTVQYHCIFDLIRGIGNRLQSDTTAVEDNISGVTSFNANSFALGSNNHSNENSQSFVAWCASLPNKKAVLGNTDGSIASTTMSNSFMSVVSYTGTGAIATVGHGLSVAPELILFKNRDTVLNWKVYNKTITATQCLWLNLSDSVVSDTANWNDTEPDGGVITIGTSTDLNEDTKNIIAYCFTSITGICKVGSYTGTGASGNAVDCGFEPQWVMIKRTDDINHWIILDNQRGNDAWLRANTSDAESSGIQIDFTSSGFTIQNTDVIDNADGGTYIYLAITKDITQSKPQYTIDFAELATAPTTGSIPSRDTELAIESKTFDGTDFTTTYSDLATTGKAIQRKLTAEKTDTTVTEPLVTQMKKEP